MTSRKEINKIIKKATIIIATHYANVTCPLFTYQPQLSDAVKKLRKF